MSFKAIQFRFIRFLGPNKEPAEFKFTSGLNVLWGSSDTGKTFLVNALDYMLGAGDALKDIPERVGYDRVLLGLNVSGTDYTLYRSVEKGAFYRYEGLHPDKPDNPKAGTKLSAGHNAKDYKNLSHWLLKEIGLDKKIILYSKEKGETKSLGFRALAHLCLIAYPRITSDKSPLLSESWTEHTRDYGVFRLLLTGVDDSSLVAEPEDAKPGVSKPMLRADALAQMISDYEDDLATLTDKPSTIEAQQSSIREEMAKLSKTLSVMEGQLTKTSAQRKQIYDRYQVVTTRSNEITELLDRFKLLDAQYTNDIKRLVAIQESGQLFVLRDPMQCPLCGALPENQLHDAACDGNVTAVTTAAAAEISKIKILQTELQGTVSALKEEYSQISGEIKTLRADFNEYKEQIETALSPDFENARKRYKELADQRAKLEQADILYKRIKALRKRLDEPAPAAPPKPAAVEDDDTEVDQYISKSTLANFSKTVEDILNAWHFPNATNVYFDVLTRDLVIGGQPRGSRGAGFCAITYSAFITGLFEYCRSRSMPHPGFVVLDSPLIAYKEPTDENMQITGTDLKQRFYEHLQSFAGDQQIFIVDNSEPPADFHAMATHFTKNPDIPRYGFFPPLESPQGKI